MESMCKQQEQVKEKIVAEQKRSKEIDERLEHRDQEFKHAKEMLAIAAAERQDGRARSTWIDPTDQKTAFSIAQLGIAWMVRTDSKIPSRRRVVNLKQIFW